MAVLLQTALGSWWPVAREMVKVGSVSVELAWWGGQFEGTTSKLAEQGFPDNPEPRVQTFPEACVTSHSNYLVT